MRMPRVQFLKTWSGKISYSAMWPVLCFAGYERLVTFSKYSLVARLVPGRIGTLCHPCKIETGGQTNHACKNWNILSPFQNTAWWPDLCQGESEHFVTLAR